MRALFRYLVVLVLVSAALTAGLAWLASVRWQKETTFQHTLGASIVQGPRAWRREVFHLKPTGSAWIGLATNTLTVAGVLLVVSSVPFALRYHLRVRRRHCGVCGYPLGRQPFCTECGTSAAGQGHVRSAVRPVDADSVDRLGERQPALTSERSD